MNLFWNADIPYIYLFDFHHFFYMSVILLMLFILLHYRKIVKIHSEKIRKSILVLSIAQQFLLYSW